MSHLLKRSKLFHQANYDLSICCGMATNKPRATSADHNLVHLCWNASHVGICKSLDSKTMLLMPWLPKAMTLLMATNAIFTKIAVLVLILRKMKKWSP
ncbi:unnamed protein product [Prunus brigantina]